MPTLTTAYLDKKVVELDTKFQERLETTSVNLDMKFQERLVVLDTKFQERLENTTKAILGLMQQGFDKQTKQLDCLVSATESLAAYAENFVKSMTK